MEITRNNKKISVIILIALLVLLIYLLGSHIKPKSFSEITKYQDSIVKCEIWKLDYDTITINNAKLDELIEILSQSTYHLNGRHENVYYGNLYYLTFFMEDDDGTKETFSAIFSDENTIYFKDKYYSFSEADNSIIYYLDELFRA